MDIVSDSGDGGEMTQIDAAACTPMASSYLQAAQEAGGAAALRQASKHSKYDSHVPEGSTFIAAAVESVGAWGSEMQEWRQAVLGGMAAEAQEAGELEDTAACSFANSWMPRLAVSRIAERECPSYYSPISPVQEGQSSYGKVFWREKAALS